MSSSILNMPRSIVRNVALVLVVPIILAIGLQVFYIQYDREPPPKDFGSGSMFDQIATRYDIINRILALGMDISWRQRMVEMIVDRVMSVDLQTSNQGSSSVRILDVATGTADVAILIANELQKRRIGVNDEGSALTAHITGVDPSKEMISVGRQKIASSTSLEKFIDLQVHDAQDLSQLESPMLYDAATMAFGIRNVPDRGKALCEIYSLLRTNATLGILEFSEPDPKVFGFLGYLVRYFIRYIIPFAGGILSGYPKEYWHLQNSIQDFPSPLEFSNFVKDLQCTTEATSYELDDLIQMNFGSVQLYLFRTLPSSLNTIDN
jgi:demethylmenaquinone methyltransferase / 2-methoxy-6-polyprenyl-1,4-benzoquinol methylase